MLNNNLTEELDEVLSNVDIKVLKKVREDAIKKGKNTDIIDKAIENNKKNNRGIKKFFNRIKLK